jgi:uncharacterized protein (TIGR00369 family)
MGAWLTASARRQTVLGLENNTSFIRATSSGVLRAAATPLSRGRTTQVWEATVYNEYKQVVAVGRVRFLCFERPSASDD